MLKLIQKTAAPVFVNAALVNLWLNEPLAVKLELGFLLSATAACLVLILAQPMSLQPGRNSSVWLFGGGCAVYMIGLLADLSLVSTFGWIMLLRCVLPVNPSNGLNASVLPLALLSTPWIHSDLSFLSASLRDTATWLVGHTLSLLDAGEQIGPSVLAVGNRTLSIAAECDGRNSLHAALIAGLTILYVNRQNSFAVGKCLVVVVLAAWLANLSRITFLAVAVAEFGDQVSIEFLHAWSGHCSVLVLCAVCYLFYTYSQRTPAPGHLPKRRKVNYGESRPPVKLSLYYSVLLLACGACVLLVSTQSGRNSQRLGRIDSECKRYGLRPDSFSVAEMQQLGAATAIRYRVLLGQDEFLLTVVDGSRHRQAVHDPEYCWTVLARETIPNEHGTAQAVTTLKGGKPTSTLYWYCSDNKRYCSPLKYMLATSLRRLSAGWLSEEPLLVVVTPASGNTINWHEFLDLFPIRSVV